MLELQERSKNGETQCNVGSVKYWLCHYCSCNEAGTHLSFGLFAEALRYELLRGNVVTSGKMWCPGHIRDVQTAMTGSLFRYLRRSEICCHQDVPRELGRYQGNHLAPGQNYTADGLNFLTENFARAVFG